MAAAALVEATAQEKNKQGRLCGSKNKTSRKKKSNTGDNVIASVVSPGFNTDNNNNNVMTTGTPVSTRHSLTGTSSSSSLTKDTPNTNNNTSTSTSTSTNTSLNTNTNASSISTSNSSTNMGNAAIAFTTTGTQTETIPGKELPLLYYWVLDRRCTGSAKIIASNYIDSNKDID